MFEKRQNQTWNVCYQYLHINTKVICIICIIFSTSSSLFLNITDNLQFVNTSSLAANQMYEEPWRKAS